MHPILRWPIDHIRARRGTRTFNAAVVVLLGHYQFEMPDPATRHRIDLEVDRNFNRIPEAPASMRANEGWAALAADRAVAMSLLKIPPAAGGLDWDELLRPWRSWPFIWFDMRSAKVWMDFRPFDLNTEQAKEFLRAKGLKISSTDPWRSIERLKP
jgi:hypothetical protein